MRPQSLTPLFAQVTSLPGIGPRLGKLVERLAGPLVVDLLWHLPFAVIDRRNAPEVAKAQGRARSPPSPSRSTSTWCRAIRASPIASGAATRPAGSASPTSTAARITSRSCCRVGEVRVVSGKVELYQGEVQMTHPDHVVPLDQRESILRVEPVYGLTTGLTQRPMQKAIAAAVERAPELPEWQDAAYLAQQKLGRTGSRRSTQAHAPAEETDLSPMHPARARLAFDELLASQLAIALVRHHNRSAAPAAPPRATAACSKRALAALPFELTPSQIFAIGRDRGRHGQARAHGAPAAGRCRQRQDAGRLPRHADRRSRPARRPP